MHTELVVLVTLERSIDTYIHGNIHDNILKVMLAITYLQAHCEQYWSFYWLEIRMRWLISTGSHVELKELFFLPSNPSMDAY